MVPLLKRQGWFPCCRGRNGSPAEEAGMVPLLKRQGWFPCDVAGGRCHRCCASTVISALFRTSTLEHRLTCLSEGACTHSLPPPP